METQVSSSPGRFLKASSCSCSSSPDMLFKGNKSSRPLPKPRRCLFIPNCLMVLSNALFSHHPTFSSFLRDLPAVSIYENGNFQYMRVQRLHVLLQAVSGHRESRLETGTPSAGPHAGRTGTGRTCQRLHCHSAYTTTQGLADEGFLGGTRQCSWTDREN